MFELHITCSKDISKLKIDFTDGSCICTEDTKGSKDPKDSCEPKKSTKVKKAKDTQNTVDSVDTEGPEDSEGPVPDWIIPDRPKKVEGQKPPEIPDLDRPPKIDEVLNNLDF